MADVAGARLRFTADTAQMLTELEKSRNEIYKLRKTVDRSANRIKYSFNKIRRAAQVVASAFIFAAGIRRLGMLAVAMAKAEDRVKLMQARFQQFSREGDAFVRIYKLSKTLGVSLDETANGMTRLLVATKSIGTAESELENVYKNIVLLGRAGGTSAEEMVGGMRQLSQGLASGRLQGEELRSVLENLPLVAMEIAKQMDIGIGQIRQAAKEGKITGDVVIDALKDIEIEMEDLPVTWAMQTANLRTEWDLFLADLSKAVDEAGLLKQLTEAVKFVRETWLGSLTTQSVEQLEFTRNIIMGEIADQMAILQEGGFDLDNPNIPAKITGTKATEWSAAMGQGGGRDIEDRYREAARRLKHLREEEKKYNTELKARYAMQRVAEDRAAAKAAADASKIDQKKLERLSKTANTELDKLKSKTKTLIEYTQLLDQLAMTFDEAGRPLITLAEHAELTAIAYDKIATAAEEAADEAKTAGEEMNEGVEESTKELEEAWKDLGLTFESAFEDAIIEGEKLRDVLHAIMKDIVRLIIRMEITQPFMGWMKKTFWPSGRATGGPVSAGSTYVVGERGPEIFTASRSGYIIPHGAMQAAGGNVVYNIDARGSDDSIFARLVPILEQTVQATKAEIRMDMNEGRF